MNAALRRVVVKAGALIPTSALKQQLRTALEGRSVALCLHRVRALGSQEEVALPEMSAKPEDLDALIETLLEACGGRRGLTVSFDDGYRDSAEYLRTRARRYPEVEWLFFVCPQKVAMRAGFRWDAVEATWRAGDDLDLQRELDAPFDLEAENAREDLLAVGADDRYALVDVAECRALASLPNVSLGNHTNLHLRATRVPKPLLEAEYRASAQTFEALFGLAGHFAFPYGTPSIDFDEGAVRLAREAALGATLWSTDARGFSDAERARGAVLPRFPIDGTWSWRASALRIAHRARKEAA